jgi:hypothetical protein
MRLTIARAAIAAAFVTAATVAEASEVIFNGSMIGTSTSVAAPPSCAPLLRLSTLIGTGSSSVGTFDYTHTVCLSGVGPIHGDFLLDFSGGDSLLGSVNGVASSTATVGLVDLALAYSILGGTGQFAGATGAFNGIGNVDQRTPGITRVNLTFTAVPEPSTWAMMLFGFGAVGVIMRRRRKQSALPQLA